MSTTSTEFDLEEYRRERWLEIEKQSGMKQVGPPYGHEAFVRPSDVAAVHVVEKETKYDTHKILRITLRSGAVLDLGYALSASVRDVMDRLFPPEGDPYR